jgi:hypothetical protein
MDGSTFFFILGYMVNIVANLYLIKTIRDKKTVEGLSFQTQIIFFIGSVTKIFYFNMTVLALHWLGWIELIASIGSSLYLVILFWNYRDFTFDKDRDFTYTYVVIPVCILASVVFHPGFFEEGFDFPSMMIACGVNFTSVLCFKENRIIWKRWHWSPSCEGCAKMEQLEKSSACI